MPEFAPSLPILLPGRNLYHQSPQSVKSINQPHPNQSLMLRILTNFLNDLSDQLPTKLLPGLLLLSAVGQVSVLWSPGFPCLQHPEHAGVIPLPFSLLSKSNFIIQLKHLGNWICTGNWLCSVGDPLHWTNSGIWHLMTELSCPRNCRTHTIFHPSVVWSAS